MILTCSAILFDLDGVLVNSIASVERQWRKFAARHKLDPDYVLHTAHGHRSIETVHILVPHLDAVAESAIVEQNEIEDTAGLAAMKGAKELLAGLPPDCWAVVTSGTRALATRRLAAAGLPLPLRMITADEVVHGKPDPEPYLKGAQAVNTAPASCLVFEDAPSGIRAAKSAGMRVIGLVGTYDASELTQADALVSSLCDVRVHRNGDHQLEINLIEMEISAAK